MPKFRVTKIEEIENPAAYKVSAHNPDIKTKIPIEDFKEPNTFYEVTLTVDDTNVSVLWHDLVLRFKFIPMLDMGSTYTLEELGNM